MSSFLTSWVFLFLSLFVNTLGLGLLTKGLPHRAGGARELGRQRAAHVYLLKGCPPTPSPTQPKHTASLGPGFSKMAFVALFDDNISDMNYFFLDIMWGGVLHSASPSSLSRNKGSQR